jgi:Lar family restriction alleviation protein
MKKIKRCPFCGGKAEVFINNSIYAYSILCTECYAESCRKHNEEDALILWNSRKNKGG